MLDTIVVAAPANMAYVSRQTVMFVQTAKAIMPLI